MCSAVTWSHHLKDEPDIKRFGENVNQKPDILKLTKDGAVFIDETFAQFSIIVYCTGYQHKFPFLSVDSGIECDDYVKPLYKHCLNINRPSMGFIGIPNLICPNQLFDLQSRFCLAFITGRKQLPSKEVMMNDYEVDMAERWKQGLPKRKAHVMGPTQDKYYVDLATTADVKPIQPVIAKMHRYTNINRDKDFLNFRLKKFQIIDDETFETHPIVS